MSQKNRTELYRVYDGESRFNGKVGRYCGLCFLSFIIVLFTLGIGTPWVICMWEKWRCDNLIIDGRQVVFEGKGRKLFWRYMGWCVLSIVTLGIYGLRVPVKLRDWLTERTHLVRGEDEPYLGDVYTKSRFCGFVYGYIRFRLLQILLVIVTLGVGIPWAICMERRWLLENMIIDGRQVIFVGRGKRLFWRYLGWSFLTLITFGIWGFWMGVRVLKWEAKNTHFD